LLQRHAPLAQDELYEIAASLGADVPACLKASSLLARGRGDVLMDAPQTPPIPVVLVNPGAPMSTAAVFRAFDQYPAPAREPMLLGSTALSVAQVLGRLEGTANDLEPHAKDLSPEIAKVLDALSRDPRSRLVRMSGSGATCFAITDTAKSAQSVAGCIAAAHPSWWVKATLLR
jgi:4-diphosphocytidyl-2-C-methyl-D-erythritol kinase